jgi:hypothetical protein
LVWKLGLLLLCALVLSGENVLAQTNKNIPGPADYAAFNRFIAERNIFDPNRVPHYPTAVRRTAARRTTRSATAPTIALVGTMTYEKGTFAFFSSNDAEQKKILPVDEKIAGYKIVEIFPTGVTLEAADKRQVDMRVGELLRQENGGWQLAGAGDVPAGAAASSPAAAESATEKTEGTPAPAVSPALEANDVLRRLMEKREKENK